MKLSEVSSEMTYQLPNDSVKNFKAFFASLDDRKDELGLKSYGIGVTTLEEVFLKVCEDGIYDNDVDSKEYSLIDGENASFDNYSLIDESVTGFELLKLQLYAMIQIRLKLVFKQFRTLIFEVIYPSMLIVFGAVIMSLQIKMGSLEHSVSTDEFPVHQNFRYSESNLVDPSLSKSVVNSFFNTTPFTSIHESFDSSDRLKDQYSRFDQLLSEKYTPDASYGSAYFRSINKSDDSNAYDVINILDISSDSVLAYFTEFMCNALIRDSTNDPEVTLNLSYGTYPRAKILDEWLKTTMAIMTVISFSLAVGSITSAMAANIVTERNESIKHQQVISGASLFAYWASIFAVDALKFVLPGCAFIIIAVIMNFEVAYGWLLLISMIVSILPFTY